MEEKTNPATAPSIRGIKNATQPQLSSAYGGFKPRNLQQPPNPGSSRQTRDDPNHPETVSAISRCVERVATSDAAKPREGPNSRLLRTICNAVLLDIVSPCCLPRVRRLLPYKCRLRNVLPNPDVRVDAADERGAMELVVSDRQHRP